MERGYRYSQSYPVTILLLAYTITALTESRPYRTAMKYQAVFVTVKVMGSKNYLDKNITHLVDENFDVVQVAKTKQQFEERPFMNRNLPQVGADLKCIIVD